MPTVGLIARATHASSPRIASGHVLHLTIILSLTVLLSACAANPDPDPATPRTGESAYPSLLVDDGGERRDAALVAWTGFMRERGITNAPPPELQPITATVRSIPALSQSSLFLPKVGDSAPMNEEETRESLRRFIADAGSLLCGDPQQLSLVQRLDGADGVKEARYQQRPFRYAMRGGYGELRIGFTADRRVTRLFSSCIPETDRIRRGFVGLGSQRITSEKAIESLKGQALTYTTEDGLQQTYTLTDKDKLIARELVVYPIERKGEPTVLEFHVAWEIVVEGSPGITIYLDSIMGDILGIVRGQTT